MTKFGVVDVTRIGNYSLEHCSIIKDTPKQTLTGEPSYGFSESFKRKIRCHNAFDCTYLLAWRHMTVPSTFTRCSRSRRTLWSSSSRVTLETGKSRPATTCLFPLLRAWEVGCTRRAGCSRRAGCTSEIQVLMGQCSPDYKTVRSGD